MPGPYVGRFYNVEFGDGSQQEIAIEALEPEGDDAWTYSYLFLDRTATGCEGVVGSATAGSGLTKFVAGTGENVLVIPDLTLYCRLNGPFDQAWPLVDLPVVQVRYDPATDRLVTQEEDVADLCWTREPPGPTYC